MYHIIVTRLNLVRSSEVALVPGSPWHAMLEWVRPTILLPPLAWVPPAAWTPMLPDDSEFPHPPLPPRAAGPPRLLPAVEVPPPPAADEEEQGEESEEEDDEEQVPRLHEGHPVQSSRCSRGRAAGAGAGAGAAASVVGAVATTRTEVAHRIERQGGGGGGITYGNGDRGRLPRSSVAEAASGSLRADARFQSPARDRPTASVRCALRAFVGSIRGQGEPVVLGTLVYFF